MFKLFIVMLSLGIILLVTAGVLYVVWDISDAVDELSGKKRLRQIEKLRKASMAIGATSVVASTTQMFRDSEEEEEIASIIQNAHNVEEVESNESVSNTHDYDENTFGDKTGIIPEEDSEISLEENSENGTLYTTSKVVFLEELTNVEV
jgi:hypothetical protein